jgi:branched-chain amino acid transport system ATP-binding protein
MLSTRGLRSAYGRVEVLHGVDLDIEEGQIVTLVGGNGAGKTTLLRCISGVQAITGGALTFKGRNITSAKAHARVALGISQSPEGRQVFTDLSVEDNLMLGAYLRRDREIQADRKSVFAMFPILEEKRALLAGGLSGGQQQMLAIGRALMARPSLLLLDEPSMGLAPILVTQILQAVTSLRDRGVTIFLVEQNANAALAIADTGYVLETGRVTLSGPARELRENAAVREAYLGI